MSIVIPDPKHQPITIPDATPTSDGVMSAADKAKLDVTETFAPPSIVTTDATPTVFWSLGLSQDNTALRLDLGAYILARIAAGVDTGKMKAWLNQAFGIRRIGGVTATYINNTALLISTGFDVELNLVGTPTITLVGDSLVMTVTGLFGVSIEWTFVGNVLRLPAI